MKAPRKSLFCVSLLTVLALPLAAERAWAEHDGSTHAYDETESRITGDEGAQVEDDSRAAGVVRKVEEVEDAFYEGAKGAFDKANEKAYEAGRAIKEKGPGALKAAAEWAGDVEAEVTRRSANSFERHFRKRATTFPPLGPLRHRELAKVCAGSTGIEKLRAIDAELGAADRAINSAQKTMRAYWDRGCPVVRTHNQDPVAIKKAGALYRRASRDAKDWINNTYYLNLYGSDVEKELGRANPKENPMAAACKEKIHKLAKVRPKLEQQINSLLNCRDELRPEARAENWNHNMAIWWGIRDAVLDFWNGAPPPAAPLTKPAGGKRIPAEQGAPEGNASANDNQNELLF